MFFKTFCALKELKQNNINTKSFHVISMIGSTVACVQIYINLKKNCGKLNNEIASITSIVSFAVVRFIFFVYTPKFDLSLLSSNKYLHHRMLYLLSVCKSIKIRFACGWCQVSTMVSVYVRHRALYKKTYWIKSKFFGNRKSVERFLLTSQFGMFGSFNCMQITDLSKYCCCAK